MNMLHMFSGKAGFQLRMILYFTLIILITFLDKNAPSKVDEQDIIKEFNEMKNSNKHKFIVFREENNELLMTAVGPQSASLDGILSSFTSNLYH